MASARNAPQRWALEGRARWLPLELSVAGVSAADLSGWLTKTALVDHSHLGLLFSPHRPSLLVETKAGLHALDELFSAEPGIRFCFGAGFGESDRIQPNFRALLQYTNTADLWQASTRDTVF
jgi:hypothetical protein